MGVGLMRLIEMLNGMRLLVGFVYAGRWLRVWGGGEFVLIDKGGGDKD